MPLTIDTGMFGRPGSTACYLLAGSRPTLVDAGSARTAETVIAALESAGVAQLDSIVLTHIHLDHAGGAGHLARRFPKAAVYVHERVARHLINPTRLFAAVKSVWGKRADELFGTPLPVPAERIVAIGSADRIPLKGRKLTAIEAAGHTRAHLGFLDAASGALFCGDALGIDLAGAIRPATPPADFSLEDSLRTISSLRALEPASLHLGHFGSPTRDPLDVCDHAAESLRIWDRTFRLERSRATDRTDLIRRIDDALAEIEPVDPCMREQLDMVNPTWLNIDGMAIEAGRQAPS